MATRLGIVGGRQHRSWRAGCAAFVLVALAAARAGAAEQIFFPAFDNVTDLLVQKINAETVRVDMSCWYLSEHAISIALINKFNSGVPVRLIGDRGSIFEIDPATKNEFYWLASQGLPIRLRFNPTWYPEIDHWKATIFAGQNLVAFGSANYAPTELAPVSSTNYDDETVLLTDDQALVNAFKAKFDQYWNDTTAEPQSLVPSPPYFKDWNDACTNEPRGCDFFQQFPNATPMRFTTVPPVEAPTPPDLIWGQGPEFNNRLVQEINNEPRSLQFVIYRLTVDNITQALLNRFQAGVQMQLIIEPNEYVNRVWPEFWITHANLDKLWAAGIPMKQRQHQGLTHMKTLVTSTYATNASSNYAAAWQRDNNYFVSASAKPDIYNAIKQRVTDMWNDTGAFVPFTPLPPDSPNLASPGSGSSNVSTAPTLTWNIAPFAVSYDVYLGTSSNNLAFVGNVPAQLVNNPPSTYSWTASTALASGTTYFWKIISRTNATSRNGSLIGPSSIWSFTTSGTAGPPPPPPPPPDGNLPSPWTTTDVGSVGIAGGASFSNGTFTVAGAGADIWGSADSFRYVYQTTSGDAEIIARVTHVQNTNTFAKAGVMLRAATSAGSADVILDARPEGSIEFMTRGSDGGDTSYIGGASIASPQWLRLTRSGSTVTASTSSNGSAWSTIGSVTVSMNAAATMGLAVTSHDTSVLNTSTFDNVSVSTGGSSPPPPPPSASNVVIYASDIPAGARHGAWTTGSDGASPNGVTLTTPDAGVAHTDAALASPSDYVDVTFTANASTPYTLWMRLKAAGNSKFNDSLWVQFSDALAGGSAVYPINSSSGLLVNLATDATAASLNNWGWQNGAYWLSQATTLTFAATGTHTMRLQVREDGVAVDQIVLSPGTYLSAPPGPVSGDQTIVPKP